MGENKILTKKEQIEIIVKEAKKITEIINKLLEIQIDVSEVFTGIYDVGYDIIPAILGIEQDYSCDSKYEELAGLFHKVVFGEITIKRYLKNIEKFLKD